MRLTIIFLVFVFLFGCVSSSKHSDLHFTFEGFTDLAVGKDRAGDVESRLGIPFEIINFDKGFRVVQKSRTVNWIYKTAKSGRFYFYFEDGILKSKTWSLSAGLKERSVKELLSRVEGKWTIVKEPMSNPHSAPSDCYLEDLKRGYLIKINGHLQEVDDFTVWSSREGDESIKKSLYKNVGKQFCIAGSCSKVSDPNAWKHDHCSWLKELVK